MSKYPRLRNRAAKAGSSALILGLLLVGMTREAKAYADPGSGALLWQSLIAMIAGVGYFWRKLGWFRKRKEDGEE